LSEVEVVARGGWGCRTRSLALILLAQTNVALPSLLAVAVIFGPAALVPGSVPQEAGDVSLAGAQGLILCTLLVWLVVGLVLFVPLTVAGLFLRARAIWRES
jgi:hypothetical protein